MAVNKIIKERSRIYASFLFDKIHLQFTMKRMKINITDIENSENKFINIDFSEVYEEFNANEPVVAILKAEIIGNLIKIMI